MQAKLYQMQREMQSLQGELEDISSKNADLEQDFENEINKKNEASKEMGQIIKAINNIHMMCLAQQKKRKKMNKIDVRDCVEDDEGLIDELIERLETCGAVIEDLVEVAKLEPNFDRN